MVNLYITEFQIQATDFEVNVTNSQPSSSSTTFEEAENEIYTNFVNPLLEKLGESFPQKEEGVPIISEELKKKIVQAILEGETEAADDNVVFDSDEGRDLIKSTLYEFCLLTLINTVHITSRSKFNRE